MTEYTFVKILHYTIYYANIPDGTTRAESAIIIKYTSKLYELEPFIPNKTQDTILQLEALSRPMVTAAVYSPPRYPISAEEYDHFLSQLEPHYLVAGNWYAKNTAWGSRLTAIKGGNLLEVIQQHNLNYFSTGEPTCWPNDANKMPGLLDFSITNGISDLYTTIQTNLDLESDQVTVPILITATMSTW
jgi:hypothetical protein